MLLSSKLGRSMPARVEGFLFPFVREAVEEEGTVTLAGSGSSSENFSDRASGEGRGEWREGERESRVRMLLQPHVHSSNLRENEGIFSCC